MSEDTNEEPVVYGPLAFITEDGATAPMGSNKRRGRKPKQAEVRRRELRLTPPDGQPIEDWQVGDPDCQISKLIAAEEGGVGTDKALHYHAVIETTYTDDALKGWIRRVLRLTPFQPLGNAIYRTGEYHDLSIGYAVKCGQISCAHGYTDDEVTKFIADSQQYRKDVTAQRKNLQRLRSQGRDRQLKTIEEIVEQRMKQQQEAHSLLRRTMAWTAEAIVELFLTECANNNIEFPTRNQMSAIINRLRWRLNMGRDNVVQFYAHGMDYTPRENYS